MSVRKLLLEILEELLQDDFKTFKWHLGDKVLDGFPPIPKARLENADRIDTVGRIIESYSEQRAVEITVEVLKLIRHYDAAEKLTNKYKALGGDASSSASAGAPPAAPSAPPAAPSAPPAAPSAPPAAPSTLTAQDQSVLISPSFVGATVGTLNINVHK